MPEPIDFFDWPSDRPEAEPSSGRGGRWRMPSAEGPVRRRRPPLAVPDSLSAGEQREPLDGLAGLFRETCLPLLFQVAETLRGAGHDASVEDLLDGPQGTISVRLRPQTGLLEPGGATRPATLRYLIEKGPEGLEFAAARCTLGGLDDSPLYLGRQAAADLDPTWVVDRLVDFVGRVLDLA